MKNNPEPSDAAAVLRWRHFFTGAIMLWIVLMMTVLSEPADCAPAATTFRADRILVKPKEGVSLSIFTNLNARLGGRVLKRFARIGNLHVISLPKNISVSNAIAFFQQSGLVKYAEPDYFVNALVQPNDFNYWNGDLWNLNNIGQYGGTPGADINATNGWDYQTSASNIIVAVIDTGVRYTHEDLAANMWINPQENLDGYTNDLCGINLVNNGRGNGDPWDDYGHGTHVAGIIGAVGNNGVGIAGICWQVQLMALKFIDSNGSGSISDAVTCMDYARAHGAKVINASWGSYGFTSAALQDAINSLRDAGVIFVAAAGNDANDNDANSLYPASYNFDNVIAVAATDRNDNLAWFSNFGLNKVKIAAPGVPVFSCWNGSDSDYQNYQGTSMAAPHVAGACALVWSKYPDLSMLQVIRRVLGGADPLPGLTNMCATGGRLNLGGALVPVASKTPPSVSIWMDDALPGGSVTNDPGGDSWTAEPWAWVTNNPVPYSGVAAHQSELVSGIHEHMFQDATETLEVFPGDTLFTYVYLDPANPPREVMIEWNDGCWEHRAFWGENLIQWGEYGTSDRLDMGALPPTGQWVRLEVSASALQLEGAVLKGMSFMLYDGRATWDYAGRSSGGN
jgi:subtilisin family serine protease